MKSLANDTNIFVKFPTENYQRPPREIWRCDCCSNCSLMWPTFRSSSLWFCGSLPPKWSPGFNSLPVISRGLKSNSCKHETRLGSRKLSLSLSCMLARKKIQRKENKVLRHKRICGYKISTYFNFGIERFCWLQEVTTSNHVIQFAETHFSHVLTNLTIVKQYFLQPPQVRSNLIIGIFD